MGTQRFVFAVAPHHPLAKAAEPISDQVIRQHRIVAAADSVQRGSGITIGLLSGQDVFAVTTMQDRLEAQLRGIGCGFLPEGLAQPYIETGRLVAKRVEHSEHQAHVSYAWRKTPTSTRGRALQWWLDQMEHSNTRNAPMCMHSIAQD